MATWLWVVGIAAIVWPVIVGLFIDTRLSKNIDMAINRSENAHFANLREEAVRLEIGKLQRFIEQQDSLIAALWEKAFGLQTHERYDSPTLPEHLGVKPQWHAHHSDWAGPPTYLARYEQYPWKTHAESLYFPD